MSTGTTKSPALPLAPVEYDHRYQDQLNTILRLYFATLDNPGPSAASTLRSTITTQVVSALNFSEINPVTGVRVVSLPTQVEAATANTLRVGDVYYDTTAGNVLKIKV